MHALGHVGHEAELERVVELETLVLQHVLSTQHDTLSKFTTVLDWKQTQGTDVASVTSTDQVNARRAVASINCEDWGSEEVGLHGFTEPIWKRNKGKRGLALSSKKCFEFS